MTNMNMEYGSKEVAACAVKIAISASKSEEDVLKQEFHKNGISSCGVNFGGEFIPSVMKIIERSVVSAKREGLIGENHVEEGCVAGATREALHQLMDKAIGLNVGGKIGIARYKEHISVCVFFGIGLLHLNEIAMGLGHRVLSYIEVPEGEKV
ncbi:MAG: HutP family protein [Clostridia bacterium]|nr:HutP family protein [Clostridia bacterium]